MNEALAASKADAVLLALISNQPSVFASNSFYSAEHAQKAAQAVASFRKTLVQELTAQKD